MKVNFNDIITTINSKDIVDELTLTDLEKKCIQSCLGRQEENKALIEIVWNRGHVTYKEFMNALHKTYSDLATKIDNTQGMIT